MWRELDGLKARADRLQAAHAAIRLVNDQRSGQPFFIHQTLELLQQVSADGTDRNTRPTIMPEMCEQSVASITAALQAEAISVTPYGAKRNGDDAILQCCLLYQWLLQVQTSLLLLIS